MPPVEIRTSLFIGLAMLVLLWLVGVALIKITLGWLSNRAARYDNEDALKDLRHTKEWVNSLLLPTFVCLLLVWCVAFAMTGWVINSSSKDPVGTLEESVEPGQLFTGSNNPETRTEEIRQEGDELQRERMDELDAFRTEFFDKRKEATNDEKID